MAVVVLGGMVVPQIVLAAPAVATVFIVAGFPYAIVALAVAVALRIRAYSAQRVASVATEAARPTLDLRISDVTAWFLLLLWLATAAGAIMFGPIVYLSAGGPLIVAALVSIITNARSLSLPRVIAAQVATVRTKAFGWRLVRTAWIVAPISWFAFAVPVLFLRPALGW